MKKLLHFLLITVGGIFALSSCADTCIDDTSHDGKGSIRLSTTLDLKTDNQSRATVPLTDFSGYTIVLKKGQTLIYSGIVPENGTIGDLEPGSDYSVELTNYTPGFGVSADPRYIGIRTNIQINASNTPTPVELVLTQANAGLYFVYDESLAQSGFGDITPFVQQGMEMITYTSHDNEQLWYWDPGEVTITLRSGGEAVPIGGEMNRTLNLEAAQLWKITLTAEVAGDGSISLTVFVEEITDPTNQEEWILGGGNQEPEVILIEGNEYINNAWFHGPRGNGSLFYLSVDDITERLNPASNGFAVYAYVDLVEYDEFMPLLPGTYTVSSTVSEDAGEPYKIIQGEDLGGYLGSSVFWRVREGGGRTERKVVSGTMEVEYDAPTQVYTITIDFEGYALSTPDVMEKGVYKYVGELGFADKSPNPNPILTNGDTQYWTVEGSDQFLMNLWRIQDIDFINGVYIEGFVQQGRFSSIERMDSGTWTIQPDAMYTPGTLMPGYLDGTIPYGCMYYIAWNDLIDQLVTIYMFDEGEMNVYFDYDDWVYSINMNFSGSERYIGEEIYDEPYNMEFEFYGSIDFRDPFNDSLIKRNFYQIMRPKLAAR